MICEMIDLGPQVNHSQQFRTDAVLGLMRSRKGISPKYFYDRRGSELFEKICDLPEYYPTRTERSILTSSIGEIAEALGNQVTLVEFGSGASTKTRLLLSELADPCAYVPIDISRDFLLESSRMLARDYRGLPILPVYADYTKSLIRLERALADHVRKVAFFPGSTIGNLEPVQARAFLRECSWFLGRGGKMLIGFDRIKDTRVLEAAYNDSQGVTAEFNINLLHRMNRELGADFDVSRFRHHAFFNTVEKRIEMHLVSLARQAVEVAGRRIEFGEEETIHTECSYKYTIEDFSRLAQESGFELVQSWTDPGQLFVVVLLEAREVSHQVDVEEAALKPDWRWAS